MLRFRETKLKEEKFYAAKAPTKICDVNVDNISISKLTETKTQSKYWIGYLDNVIKPLVLIIPKMSAYVENI